jgi:hypothetical protein
MLEISPKTPSGTHVSLRSAFGYSVLSRIRATLDVIQMSMNLPLSLATISSGDGVQDMVAIEYCSVGKGVIGWAVNSAIWVNLLPTIAVPVAKSGEIVRSAGCRTFAVIQPANKVANNTTNIIIFLRMINIFRGLPNHCISGLHTPSWYFVTAYGRSVSCPVWKLLKSEIFRSADRCDGFSLELMLPVHLPDPIPKCMTTNIEIIIAQIPAICTGNLFFSLPAGWMRSSRPVAGTGVRHCTLERFLSYCGILFSLLDRMIPTRPITDVKPPV